jgi:hypothetical protein
VNALRPSPQGELVGAENRSGSEANYSGMNRYFSKLIDLAMRDVEIALAVCLLVASHRGSRLIRHAEAGRRYRAKFATC